MDISTTKFRLRVFECIVAITLTFAAWTAHAHQFVANDLLIMHPYTIEPAAGTTVDVPIYMVIKNSGGVSDRLLSASSPFGKSVAIVTRVAGAEPVTITSGIELPANSETTVGPRAAFVLLRNLTESLGGYQYFPMTLVFEKTGTVEVEVYVEDASEIPSSQPKQ